MLQEYFVYSAPSGPERKANKGPLTYLSKMLGLEAALENSSVG